LGYEVLEAESDEARSGRVGEGGGKGVDAYLEIGGGDGPRRDKEECRANELALFERHASHGRRLVPAKTAVGSEVERAVPSSAHQRSAAGVGERNERLGNNKGGRGERVLAVRGEDAEDAFLRDPFGVGEGEGDGEMK